MELMRNGHPRIVITGMGVTTPLGDVDSTWAALMLGQSGITHIENMDTDYLDVKIAGEVKNFQLGDYVDRKEARRMGRASQFAVETARAALIDAGFNPDDPEYNRDEVGVVIGTTLGSTEIFEGTTHMYRRTDQSRINPLALVGGIPNMPAHYVSRFFQARGPLITPSNACATGTQAIGQAADMIRDGHAEILIAGGVECILTDYIIAGFVGLGALATNFNDAPALASRPFDKNRSGFIISEGCALVTVETMAHALKRGAKVYAEVVGHATTSDAYHMAAIDPEGLGATRSMSNALRNASLKPDDIGYINAHGTSTKHNDAIETLAIRRVFGDYAYELPVSSTKSMLGHAMAASGAIETVICVKTLQEQTIAPTINYETPDPECDLDYVTEGARKVDDIRYVMSNGFGLGGQNATIILGKV